MDIQEIESKFEDLLMANPDFDESLLEKDEDGSYEDSDINSMYQMFEAGTEIGQKWRAAKAQAVPKNTETVYLVWNKSHCECVGFTDKQDAKYASTGRQTSMGYSSLAGEFREIYEDEMSGDKFDITEIQIEAQEQSHD